MNPGDLVRPKCKEIAAGQLGVITRIDFDVRAYVLFTTAGLRHFYFYELELVDENG